MADARPSLRPPADAAERLRAALGDGWRLEVVDEAASGVGDGAAALSAAGLETARGAEVYVGFGVPDALLDAAPDLRWAHTGAAGVGSVLTPRVRGGSFLLTNSAGIHGPPVAETALAMILHFARGLDVAVRAQARAEWDKRPFDAAPPLLREIGEATVGVFGYGGIGREVARRAGALGARVLAARRRGNDAEPGVTLLTGTDRLERLLDESDYLVLCAPETDETRGAIDGAALARMRPDAVLINVARGGLVDEDALLDALRQGRLRGAGLDVFATEPLPGEHALWREPRVLITPHVSSYGRGYWRRELALIEDNIERYLAGRPLRNVVDRSAGY